MRLLIVGDSPALLSGQARMVRELAKRFHADGVDVTVAGWHHLIATARFHAPYEILPTPKDKPAEIAPILARVRPDAVLCIGDPWEFAVLSEWRSNGASWRLYGYFNVEFSENPPNLERVFDGFDDFRITSKAGAAAVGRDAQHVWLGVDPAVFSPGPRPPRLLGRAITDDTVVILVNAMNRPRKNLGSCVAAIERFARDSAQPVLGIFNTAAQDPHGTALQTEIVRHDAEDLIVFNTANYGPDRTVSEETVVDFYRAADLLLVMSWTEGFCLPVLEAMATRTLVVAPEAYSMPELLDGGGVPDHSRRGQLYPAGSKTLAWAGGWCVVPDPEVAAQALLQAAQDIKTSVGHAILNRAQAFAQAQTWDACYAGVSPMIAEEVRVPRWPALRARAADGGVIDPLLRWRARQRSVERIGVVKIGGMGDMLMATRVIRAACAKWQMTATVFCNDFSDIFDSMPEVEDVVRCNAAAQEVITRSVADEFGLFLDLRLPARAYGTIAPEATPLSKAFAWMTDGHIVSLQRLHTLGRHATTIMLESLGLPSDDISPVYERRAPIAGEAIERIAQAIVIGPGAGKLGALKKPDREWWEEFVHACHGRPVIQTGSYDDPLIKGCLDARGWGLPVTASLFAAAAQCVFVESGLAHLARAVRQPRHARTIVLFGPTHPVSYAYGEHVNLTRQLCEPCFFGPAWIDQTCAMAARTCLNLPELPEVMKHVVPL